MIESVRKSEKLNNDDIMTSEEVANYLKVSISAVRRWARDGSLKGHRLGGKGDWRYIKKDVINFLYGEI